MFLKKLFNRKPKAKTNGHNTLIGDITIDGDITGNKGDSIVINGTVMGSVRLEPGENSTITIGTNGKIYSSNETDNDTEIISDHIVIYGEVAAVKIHALHSLIIMSTAKVTSKYILYGSLTVNEGAMITGYLKDEHGN